MAKLKTSTTARICLYALFCLAICSGLVRADEKSDTEQLVSIRKLADSDNNEALKRLELFLEKQTSGTSAKVRLATLNTLVTLYFDAGRQNSAKTTLVEFKALADKTRDLDAQAITKILDTGQLLDAGRPDDALKELQKIGTSLHPHANPDVRMRLQTSFARTYFAIGNFSGALEHALDALRQTDQLPDRRVENRMMQLYEIARLYAEMKDPEKALSTVNDALLLYPLANSPKVLSLLTLCQGVAYTFLKRQAEAIDAYQRSLKLAGEVHMPLVQVRNLVNISDHYLILNEYAEAEAYARQALEKAELLQDKKSMGIAKANLGFALAGQGKISQGVVLINAVINALIDSDQQTDAEAVIGELANMYENAGMYKEALLALRQQQSFSNELFRSDRSKTVAVLQEQFNAEQRQKQIELLAKDNALKDADIRNHRLQQIVTLLGAVLTVMAGIFIYWLYRRVKRINLQLQEANSQLEFHAVRDPLTGLHNRRSFLDMMKVRSGQGTERRDVNPENPDTIILLDIDHFKQINDGLGHAAGDAVLMEVAHRLRSVVRDTDMVLRWGGEEFLVFAPKSTAEQIAALVTRVLHVVGAEPIQAGHQQIQTTMTAGFISLPFSGIPEEQFGWEKVLQIADMALYLGKANGRNRAYGISSLLAPAATALPVIETDLAAAVAAGMVELIEVMGPAKLEMAHC
ncbi:diguanylate cyclase [Undibacterium sp. 14-3-2]|uniref:tetratricopeptide repeat-containing diguanylate cyclase n=1 Tax=Undibacterium sp. 14-3-2 TaxID=2800129 RepID=UPI0019035091|nr:diguanylate cyclase [Undibacterium sp. 14-3-2]MBK1889922.1 diguanylate cyclase [Undibacterium sp. 14-3-2]